MPVHYPELGPCWVWTGAKNRKGYGMFAAQSSLGRASIGAHRWAWIREVGEIAEGLVIDHLCRNRSCVRVSHMEPVTNGENSLRGETFAADNIIKTHCKWGHALTPDNLYRVRDHPTRRHCRTCALNRSRGLHPSGRPLTAEECGAYHHGPVSSSSDWVCPS